METHQWRYCFKSMLIHVVNNRLASYFDETFYWGNKHKAFCRTRFLWDPTVKKSGATLFLCTVCNIGMHVICDFWVIVLWYFFFIFDKYQWYKFGGNPSWITEYCSIHPKMWSAFYTDLFLNRMKIQNGRVLLRQTSCIVARE